MSIIILVAKRPNGKCCFYHAVFWCREHNLDFHFLIAQVFSNAFGPNQHRRIKNLKLQLNRFPHQIQLSLKSQLHHQMVLFGQLLPSKTSTGTYYSKYEFILILNLNRCRLISSFFLKIFWHMHLLQSRCKLNMPTLW